MITRLKVPKLGMTMVEATLATWQVDDGSEVAEGDVVCTIEADKTEIDIHAPVAGTIRLIAEKGVTYDVGEYLAEIRS